MVIDIIIPMEEYRQIRPMFKNIKRTCGDNRIKCCYVLRGAAVRVKVAPDYLSLFRYTFSMGFKQKDAVPGKSDCIILEMTKHNIIDLKLQLWEQ